MIREACPIAASRAGLPLPTLSLLRDLQLYSGTGSNLAVQQSPMAQLAGAARPQTVFDRAGIAPIEINDAQIGSVPRWRGNGGGWIIEGEQLAEAPLEFSTVSVSARMAGCTVTFSRKLRLSTTGDLQAAVLAEMERQVRQVLEDGLLNGVNEGGEPLGLLAQAAGLVTFAGVAPTWSELLQMLEALADADGDLSNAVWLAHPSTAVQLLSTARTSGNDDTLAKLDRGSWTIADLPAVTSTLMPEGRLVLMDRRAVNHVYFGPPMMLADPYSGSNSITGKTTLIVSNYADLAVSEPALVILGQ